MSLSEILLVLIKKKRVLEYRQNKTIGLIQVPPDVWYEEPSIYLKQIYCFASIVQSVTYVAFKSLTFEVKLSSWDIIFMT